MSWRDDVVAEARTWLGTPYHHAAGIKGAGVDCLYLIVEVFTACGVIERPKIPYYPMDIMMHRNEETYLHGVLEHAIEVDHPQPGDVALFKFGRIFSHAAIVVDWPTVIHSYRTERGAVIGNASIGEFSGRDVRFFEMRR